MDLAIRELFAAGLIKESENKEIYNSIISHKSSIDEYFAVINRAVLVNEQRKIIYLCAPVTELDPEYDPYANILPSPEDITDALKRRLQG